VTQTCSCKRLGLPCIPAYRNSHGVDCENRHEELGSSASIVDEEESFLAYLDVPGMDDEIVGTA